jgi:hypothetical protein
MTFTFKLEQADGTTAHKPTMRSAVYNWKAGEAFKQAPTLPVPLVASAG